MSNAEHTSDHSRNSGAMVIKSDLPSLLSSFTQTGTNGEFYWPIAPLALLTLYKASAEHCRAIHLKAESAFGGGLMGAKAHLFDDLTDTGFTELAVGLAVDWETFGNAFVQIIRSSDKNRVIGLRRLPAITIMRTETGYVQRVNLPNGKEKKYTFSQTEIIHLRNHCPQAARYALPDWIGATGMLELTDAATRYNASFFKNNAVPEYAVMFKGATPTKEQKQSIIDFFRNEHRGFDNAHRTLILNSTEETDIQFERITADVKDGDFIKLLDAARDRIPVAHGVPPRMLGIMTAGQLGGGGEVSSQLFVFEHLTNKPKRRRMLDQLRPILSAFGLRPGNVETGLADTEVAFKPLDLTPPDDDFKNLPDLVSAGILTEDEARAFLPMLQGLSDAAGTPIERSASDTPEERLAALLNDL